MIHKQGLILSFFLLIGSVGHADIGEHPHSFFMPRPISARTLLTAGTMFTAPAPGKKESPLSVEHTFFHVGSTDNSETAPFFLGKNKASLSVDETENGDLNPQWFSIESATGSDYKSTLAIKPSHSSWGVVLRMQQELGELYDGLWIAASIPLVEVTHNIHLSEQKDPNTATDTNSLFSSMKQALDWDNWRAGKISSVSQTARGADDVGLQCGITLTGPRKSQQRIYVELTVPVGGHPTAQYLFEPIIGNAGSFGFGGGSAALIPLVVIQDRVQLMFVNQTSYRYHFSTRQQRTPDLKGQPFSRYLIFMDTDLSPNVTNVSMKAANGVNFFTRDVIATPGATGQSMSALEVSYKQHAVTLGYNYWWRAAEQVTFESASTRTFAVPSPKGLIGPSQAWLPSPQIGDQFSQDDPSATTNAAVLNDIEFNMDSVAAPYTASHTLFARYTGRFSFDAAQVNASFGCAYEMADNVAALNTWQLWAGIGITL